MNDWAPPIIDIIRAHAGWAWPVIFFVSFCESLVVLSLLVPGTVILLAASSLVPIGALDAWPLITSATAGAVAGDAVSYWLGRYCRGLASCRPLARYPGGIATGLAFFRRHGGKGVFIGRFFGPLRAFVPLAAGMSAMKPGAFWTANILSALIWAPMLVLGGNLLGRAIERLLHWPPELLVVLGVPAATLFVLWRRRQRAQNLTP
jgi:membrane protein DedA with SNARE-associated domain